jgi:hypothetical protein
MDFTSGPFADVSDAPEGTETSARSYTQKRDYFNEEFYLRPDVPEFKVWLSKQSTMASKASESPNITAASGSSESASLFETTRDTQISSTSSGV